MPSRPGNRFDFFVSRRGSVAAIAQEVASVLTEKGYDVLVQDYDIPLTANFIEEMHEAIKNARDLVVLFRLASVVPSLPAKPSRLRRSWRSMGSTSPEIPMTK